MFGARTSLLVGAGAVLLAAAIGVPLGIVAGYTRGPLDDLIMRLVDLQLAFPPIFLAIAVMGVVGQNLGTVAAVLGIVSWPQYARVARGSTLVVARSDYVEAVIALGAGVPRILARHILPNVLTPLVAIAAVNVSAMILAESGLSFLGLGVQPPTPAWGAMLAESRTIWDLAPWMALLPGLAIMLTVLGVNLMAADALEH
jgi:peptide/nickel transport system permease protein